MPLEGVQNTQKFYFYCNDGMISRANVYDGIFEVRNFKTGEWNATLNPSLIQKMIMGRRVLPSEEAADKLFHELQKDIK